MSISILFNKQFRKHFNQIRLSLYFLQLTYHQSINQLLQMSTCCFSVQANVYIKVTNLFLLSLYVTFGRTLSQSASVATITNTMIKSADPATRFYRGSHTNLSRSIDMKSDCVLNMHLNEMTVLCVTI